MLKKRKNTLALKAFAVLLSLSLTTAGFSANAGSARIIPSGNVFVIENGQTVSQFSQEAPLPQGSLLRCESKCDVKMDDTYMVADPGTEFSITTSADSTALYVKTGTVFYSINESSRPIQITTPNGDSTTGDLTMTDNELRGYVTVTSGKTEIGVIGGGTMMVETASGEIAIISGNAVTMAAVDSTAPGATAASTGEGFDSDLLIVIGAAGAFILAVGASTLVSGGGGGGGGKDGSPSSP